MPDYYGACIRFGGTVTPEQLVQILTCALDDGAQECRMPRALLACLPPELAQRAQPHDSAHGYAAGCLPWGQFDSLEAYLRQEGLAFDRHIQPEDGFDGSLLCHRPGHEDITLDAGADGNPVISAAEVERLITETRDRDGLVAALRQALGGDLPPLPPLSLRLPARVGTEAEPMEDRLNVRWILHCSVGDVNWRLALKRLSDAELTYCLEHERRATAQRYLQAEARRRGLHPLASGQP